MPRYIPLIVGVVLVAVATAVHGAMTLRWTGGTSAELDALAKRYELIPRKFGDWVATAKDSNISERQLIAAGGASTISRQYYNPNTKQTVQVFMICGFARNTAVHTPDVCYPGNGFKAEKTPKVVNVNNGLAKAYVTTFTKQVDGRPLHQRIFWMWNVGKGWQAPDAPRMQYRGWSALNKLYLIASANTLDKANEADKAELAQFAEVFLPEVHRILYPPAAPPVAVK